MDQQTGNLFICNRGNYTIRNITPQGTWEDLLLVRDTNGIKQERSQHLLGHLDHPAVQMGMAKQRGSVLRMGYASMRSTSRCLCVMLTITSSEGSNSMVFASRRCFAFLSFSCQLSSLNPHIMLMQERSQHCARLNNLLLLRWLRTRLF